MTARAAAAALLAAAALPALAAKKPLGPGERIDLNTASASELQRLPGVGKARADAIVAYRTRHAFRRPEEVTRVRGVSAAWFARVKGHLEASPAPTPAARAAPRAIAPPPRPDGRREAPPRRVP